MSKRILFDGLFVLTLFYAPWWAVLFMAMFGVYYFNLFYEVMVFGVIYDILYGVTGDGIFGYGTTGFIFALTIFFFIDHFKKELR